MDIEQLKQAARGQIGCINPMCDTHGTIAIMGQNGEPQPEQCEFCYKRDEIVTSTYLQAVEDTKIEEHKPRLELWNDAVEEGRRRERGFIMSLIDGRKVVYKEGDKRFYEDAKDGEEKDHIDSCCNETLDQILQSLKQTKD